MPRLQRPFESSDQCQTNGSTHLFGVTNSSPILLSQRASDDGRSASDDELDAEGVGPVAVSGRQKSMTTMLPDVLSSLEP